MATERLRVILEMMASQYKKEAREAATATGKISTETKSASSEVGKFGGVLKSAAVIGGITAVGRGLWQTVEAAERINSIAAITNQVIKGTGGVANVTADQVLKMADNLEVVTGVESELIQEGSNVLLTFRNIRNEVGEGNDVFDRTVGLMLDIGAVMGTDASSAALQLGKALNDPVSQMGALSRAGLTFNAEQKEMIKTMAESGNLVGAQTLILDELETQLGGTAAASVDSSDRIVNAFGRITDAIGLGLLPVLDETADNFDILTGAATRSQVALRNLIGNEKGAADSADTFADSITHAATALNDWWGQTDRAAREGGVFRKEVDALWESMELGRGEIQRLANMTVDTLAHNFGLTADQAEYLADFFDNELVAAVDAGTLAFRDGSEPVLEYGRSATEASGGVEELEEETYDAAAALEEASDKLSTAIELTGEYFDLLDSRMDGIRALRDAQYEAAEAQDAVNEAIEEHGKGSDEHLAALEDQSLALQDVREAEQSLVEQGGLTRAEFVQQQIQLGLTRDEANLLADELDELFKPRTVHNQIINTITNTTSGGGGGAVVATARAAGGPGNPNQMYLTSEQGPELFVPHARGHFFDASSTSAILNALSGLGNGGNSYSKTGPTINLNGPINGVDEVMSAVQRASGLTAMVDLAEVNPR